MASPLPVDNMCCNLRSGILPKYNKRSLNETVVDLSTLAGPSARPNGCSDFPAIDVRAPSINLKLTNHHTTSSRASQNHIEAAKGPTEYSKLSVTDDPLVRIVEIHRYHVNEAMYSSRSGNAAIGNDYTVTGNPNVSNANSPTLMANHAVFKEAVHPLLGSQYTYLDLSRSHPTFSVDELGRIKYAAEFLLYNQCFQDASELFALLLDETRMEASSTCSPLIISATIGYARSYWGYKHQKFMQRFYESPPKSPTGSLSWALHEVTALAWKMKDTGHRISKEALGFISSSLAMLDQAFKQFTPLILFIYQCRKLVLREVGPKGDEFVDLENELLYRQPGPFEYRYGQLQNPTLRSCMQWCLDTLSTLVNHEINRQILVDSQSQNSLHHLRCANLLTEFWKILQEASPYPTWYLAAEQRMGISSLELLATCCSMILRECSFSNNNSCNIVVAAVKIGAHTVVWHSDKKLAHKFLSENFLIMSLLKAPEVGWLIQQDVQTG